MKVPLFLFPLYVDVQSAMSFSPLLKEFLNSRGVELVAVHWNGRCDDLPWDTKMLFMVRVSTMMRGPELLRLEAPKNVWGEISRRCTEHGHFCFYNDQLVLENSELVSEGLLEAAEKFLARLT